MADPFGDIDEAPAPQVKPVMGNSGKPATISKDIDEGHGGINSTRAVPQRDDVVRTVSTTAPTAKDLGIS